MQHPRNCLDITTGTRNTFSKLPARLIMAQSARRNFFTAQMARKCLGIMAAAILLAGGSVSAPAIPLQSFAAETTAASAAERETLEKELKELEAQIVEHEKTIISLKKEGKTLSSEIKTLTSKVDKLNLQIRAVTLSLARLDKEIAVKEGDIKVTETKIDKNREALSHTLQQMYEQNQVNLIEVLLQNPTLTAFVGGVNTLLTVQNNLSTAIQKITELKNELVDKREELVLQRADAAELKAYQASQRAAVESTKKEKNTLLTATKGKESEFQKLLVETRKTAAQIRDRLFQLLGGGQMTFGEAYKIAKFTEDATGVSAALILAVVDRESALGQNVGRCNYKTAMHPTRDIPIFLELTASLGIDPSTVLVSCANVDGAYGGAMGATQFIPSTWNIYKERIGEIVGTSNPSPWNNSAAFVGTALYLKDAGAGTSVASWREATARYYAGSRWRRHLWGYGDRVAQKALQFAEDIKELVNS